MRLAAITANAGLLIAENAKRYAGVKYVPHSSFHTNFNIKLKNGKFERIHNPHSAETGLDCSALANLAVANTFRALGIIEEVPRHVKGFYRWRFTMPVRVREIQPGDLLFAHYNPKRNPPDHIGIYTGSGFVLHSSSKGSSTVEKVGTRKFGKVIAARRVIM